MQLFGHPQHFAIACAFTRSIESTAFAQFCFQVAGHRIGDPEDEVLLATCVSYLKEFLETNDRTWPDAETLPKERLFAELYDSIIHTVGYVRPDAEPSSAWHAEISKDPLARYRLRRFHLDHLGDASFRDKFSIIMIHLPDGSERIIWRDIETLELREHIIPAGVFERAAQDFLAWADTQLR